MANGISASPQFSDREGLHQLFIVAAARFGGIAPEDLPSFENAPVGIDWRDAVRGNKFQEDFKSYVRNCSSLMPADEGAFVGEISSLSGSMFDRIQKAVLENDPRMIPSLPNVLLIAAQAIEDQAPGEINKFGFALYKQANAIWNAAAGAAMNEANLPGRVQFVSAPPPRFPEDVG